MKIFFKQGYQKSYIVPYTSEKCFQSNFESPTQATEKIGSGKHFRDWICDDVLPSIHKYGYYIIPKLRAECDNAPERIKAKLSEIALTQFVDYCSNHPDETVDMFTKFYVRHVRNNTDQP